MMPRRNISKLWNYFTKYGDDYQAICTFCKGSFSYKTTIGNLRSHLKRMHPTLNLDLTHYYTTDEKRDDDDDSLCSVKFSSEIWAQFEQDNEGARCTICQKTTENTVEDMRSHLEEEHPAVLIKILRKEAASDEEQSREDTLQEDAEDSYTEIVYLEEEPVKRPKPRNPLKRRQSTRQDRQETHRLEHKANAPEARSPESDHVDPFLNYIKALLKNVPKESFPKLQLDIISMILNAQINASQISLPQTVTVSPIQQTLPQGSLPQRSLPLETPCKYRTVPSVGSMVTVTESEDATDGSTRVNTIASTADYHITIGNKEKDTL